jgi:hypothetical protein
LFSQAFLHNAHIPGNTHGALNFVSRKRTLNVLPCAWEVKVEFGELSVDLFNADNDKFGCLTTIYFLVVLRRLTARTFFFREEKLAETVCLGQLAVTEPNGFGGKQQC